MNVRFAPTIIPLVCVMALSACSSNEGDAPAASTPAAEQAAAATPAAAAGSNPPLTQDQVSTVLETMGEPAYSAADDTLRLSIRVTNNGTATLPATGGSPVALGLLQLVDDPANPDGKRGLDLRVALKGNVDPGKSQVLEATVPADFLLGNRLQAELLQDNVAWFGFNFNQPVLVWGPFARCADGKGLCDGAGKAVASTP